MKKIVYVLTRDPQEHCEMVSSALAQALTALSFGYECEIFLSDNGVKLILPEYIAGLKAGSFNPLAELLEYCKTMGGRVYACNPSLNSRNIDLEKDTSEIAGFVNASQLLESSMEADAIFTY